MLGNIYFCLYETVFTNRERWHTVYFTLYPASSTAFLRTESSTFFDIVRTAEPFSWLTSADSTPSIASRVFFTVASQCGHIIPSIFIVFSMVLFSFLFLCFIFLSCFELWTLTKLSLNAFVTTQKLERLIAAAPNIGFNCQPKRLINAPMASGIPITL